MRTVKQVLIGAIVFSTILLLFSILLPSHIRVSKSVLINVAKEEVMTALLDVNDWKDWNPILQDSSVTYSLPSPALAEWTTIEGISNSIELEKFSADSISATILSNGKQDFTSGFTVVQHEQDSLLTKVEWWINEDIIWYPWEKFYGLFSESFRETYMDNSLQLFKYYVESK